MQLPADIAISISEALANQGYLVIDQFLPDDLTQELYHYVRLIDKVQFTPAAIGRAEDKQHDDQIRNDKTRWLSEHHELEHHYLDVMDQLRVHLNRNLFLGLQDYEAHFAHFEAGNYYQRHLDAFRGQSNRVVSTVFYLNDDWTDADGGKLKIYQQGKDELICSVSPTLGKLVIFLSEHFPHQVMPANKDRFSIAGWFRSDSTVL